ncbi:hypothetical protein V490_05291 [Pseudogymnoascus sp. VKM F-3557]|nr:hypothetical protein V490_05291 [Pseudogymnoascus sp. VKM F-3557]
MGFLKVAAVALALCSAVSQATVLPHAPAIPKTDFDVIVIGGGPAGLSALSGVSRVRRTALLLDSQEYRNGLTRHMHDVIGNDGTAPEKFRALAREQISRYPTAQIKFRKATSIVSQNNGSSFLTTDNSGQTYTSRKVILATGLRDILPDTPGIKDAWSRGIYWCPWCDGWEHRDLPFGILGSIVDVVGSVLEIATLNKDLIAFTNGTHTAENEKKLDKARPGWREQLKGYGVKLDNRTIVRIERLQDGAVVQNVAERIEYDEFRVHFTEGAPVNRSAFITNYPSVQTSYIGKPLGVKYYGEKMNVNAGSMRTDVPGVWAVGDANSDNSTNVPHAMFSGKKAAVYCHVELEREKAATFVTKRDEDEIFDLMGRELSELFGQAFNKVYELYNEDNQEECISAAQNLLQDPNLPRYHRIKTLLLLGSAFPDWDDVETCRLAAERIWEQAHRHYSRVDDPDAHQALAELRADLDTMGEMQREELDEMFRDDDNEYEVEDDGEGDEEEYEKEGEREADVEIDADVDDVAGAGADASADVDAMSLDGMENAPDVAAREYTTDEGELTFGKSEEGTEDKNAPATTLRRNKLTGSLRSKAGKRGGLAHRPRLAALRSRVASGQQQYPDTARE